MQKIGDSTSTANGAKEFTKGQPGTGVDATVITAEWLNAIQRELVNLVLGGGLTIVPGDDSQVLKAIQAIQLAAVTWAKLGGKPTTVSGFGITDAFTKTETATAIQKAVSDLVDSSPAALDTLKELAEALGNDPNFATTVTNALASKAAKATSLAGYGIIDAYSKGVTYSRAEVEDLLALEVGRLKAIPIFSRHQKLSVWATGTNSVISLKAEKLVIGSGSAVQAVGRVEQSLNMQSSGLGGLDVGVVAPSSCYGAWVATNGESVAATAALMPVLLGSTTLGSPVITGLPSTASMRVGMQFSSALFPWGVTIKSIDSASQITASHSALATAASDNLRFAYEPVLPAGYIASRFSSFFTDSSANKFPLSYTQWNRFVRIRPAAATNVVTLPGMVSGVQGNPSHPPTFVPVALGAFVPPTALKISLTLYGYLSNSSLIAAPNPGHYGVIYTPIGASPLHLSQGASAGATHVAASGEMVPERGYIFYASNAGASGLVLGGWEDDV
ncbi:hypothetical protein [Pseudomonas extremaustralis]|uniref:Phage tail protein n=1 Tax=Pseudomonas extremaustralis TaxID=359110 RepID=A0ABY0N5I7_9PSED|nr:hypothetical protein [Pseudomonas extremaustralis]EZI28380.1 hypothetical protein PE143B_0112100 [Pseudomonas extremaustralis 14-3 substr. 14-3b]SDE86584.1 hypothetical protein SAMN05216591_1209 [Pseudomonas extremaustralis]